MTEKLIQIGSHAPVPVEKFDAMREDVRQLAEDHGNPPTVPVMKGKRRIGWTWPKHSAERAAIEYRANAAEKLRIKKFRKLQKKRGVR